MDYKNTVKIVLKLIQKENPQHPQLRFNFNK
jgi:hypothetical protein